MAMILLLVGIVSPADAEVERNVLLDNAFKMLDEGNGQLYNAFLRYCLAI